MRTPGIMFPIRNIASFAPKARQPHNQYKKEVLALLLFFSFIQQTLTALVRTASPHTNPIHKHILT